MLEIKTHPIMSLPPQSTRLLLPLGVSYLLEPTMPSITAITNNKASSKVKDPIKMKIICLGEKKKKKKETVWLNLSIIFIFNYLPHKLQKMLFTKTKKFQKKVLR